MFMFIGKFEENFVSNNNPYLSYLKCWYRYIDEIFFIVSGTLALLEEFVGFLNNRMSTIKFLLEYDFESFHFLDVEVCKRD